MDAEKKREGVKNVSLARPFFEAALEGWEMRVYTYCTRRVIGREDGNNWQGDAESNICK